MIEPGLSRTLVLCSRLVYNRSYDAIVAPSRDERRMRGGAKMYAYILNEAKVC